MRRLAALAEISLSRPGLPALLRQITGVVKKMLPSTEASLIMWDPDLERFDVSASTMPDQRPSYVADEVRDRGGASRWIIDELQPVAVHDIGDDPFGASRMLFDGGFRAYLGVPVVFEDDPLGVLYALDDAPRRYHQADIDFMTILARRASTAIGFARMFEQLQELARTDDLTGVLNRGEFYRRARSEFDRDRRYSEPISVMLIDVDHFKLINDGHGHAIGDFVLSEIARRCARILRSIDIFGRIGGEEFAALLPETDGPTCALVAERLRAVVAEAPIDTDAGPISTSVTVGVAERDPRKGELATVMATADRALYAGKAAGRNRVATA